MRQGWFLMRKIFAIMDSLWKLSLLSLLRSEQLIYLEIPVIQIHTNRANLKVACTCTISLQTIDLWQKQPMSWWGPSYTNSSSLLMNTTILLFGVSTEFKWYGSILATCITDGWRDTSAPYMQDNFMLKCWHELFCM